MRKIHRRGQRKLIWQWGVTDKGHALDFATSRVPPVSASDLAHRLALRYQKAREANVANLKVVQGTFLAFLAVGSAQLLVWTVVVWSRGA